MLRTFILFLFVCGGTSLQAQTNLVVNGSFEELDTCPNSSGQLWKAKGWDSQPLKDIELYNACSDQDGLTIPRKGLFQTIYSKTGVGVAGFLPYNGYGVNYREYLLGNLSKNLEKDKYYYISYSVILHILSRSGLKNIDLAFSNIPISNDNDPYRLPKLERSFKNETVYLTDTLNWQEVGGIYYAKGDERYFALGNFLPDSLTERSPNFSPFADYDGSYYYLDDVSIVPLDSLETTIKANAGPDQSLFGGDSVFVGVPLSGHFCTWYANGVKLSQQNFGFYVSPTQAVTEYVVELNLNGQVSRDTSLIYLKDAGLKTIEKSRLNIAPNPSTGKFKLQFRGSPLVGPYRITDLSGKTVQHGEFQLQNGESELMLHEVNGVYLLYFQYGQVEEVHKLIIQQ